jgi:hypothetical protein
MNRKICALAVSFAVLATPVSHAENASPALPERGEFKVFLLAGQSNMAGRGNVTDADRKIHPRILMLAKDGSWQYAVDPVHYDKPRAGVGLARSFAMELVKQDETLVIGLVPAACGGSPISSWEPGGYHEQTDSHPYDDAIERTKRALQDGQLAGILWHQGESDSRPQRSVQYKGRLVELIERFRRELDAPDVPFIIGQLGRFKAKPWTAGRRQVDRAHREVSVEVSRTGFVSSEGLTALDDNTHFNTESLYEFGRRYAGKWLEIVEDKPTTP